MKTIFDRVSRGNENSSTQLLVNLMDTSYIRESIFDFFHIDKTVYEKITPEHISTQIKLDGVGQPDIVIKNNDVYILIECKISVYTETQKTQYTTYIDEVTKSDKKVKKIIYLLPKKYDHPEINNVVSKHDFCSIIHWDDLLEFLYNKEIHKGNFVTEHVLEHLSNLIVHKELSIKPSREELVMMCNPKELIAAHGLVIKTYKFIENVEKHLIEKLGNDFSHSDATKWDNESSMGKYLNYKKFGMFLFLGFNYLLNFPEQNEFFFAFDIKKDIIKNDKISNNVYFDGDWYYFELDKFNCTDFDHPEILADEICTIIKEYVL